MMEALALSNVASIVESGKLLTVVPEQQKLANPLKPH
jgi:hypothetical protein